MKLVADNTRLMIDTPNREYTAQEIDTLISQLAELRSNMTPPVPDNRRELEQAGTHITMEDNPEMTVAHLRDGRFRLWVRNAGFGWCAYNVDADRAASLADYMSGRLKAGDKGISLISQDIGKAH